VRNLGIILGACYARKTIEPVDAGGKFFLGIDTGAILNAGANSGIRNFKSCRILSQAVL
jgi:hypothetical protein